jgi:hypothetical protein
MDYPNSVFINAFFFSAVEHSEPVLPRRSLYFPHRFTLTSSAVSPEMVPCNAFVTIRPTPPPPSGASKSLKSTSQRGRMPAMKLVLSIGSGVTIRVVGLCADGLILPQCQRDYTTLVSLTSITSRPH